MPETTKEHFKIFKEEGEYWLNRYGFGDFEAHFLHRNSKELGTVNAWEFGDHQTKGLVLSLTKKWETEPNEYEIRKFAYHEVNEALLDKLCILAESRFDVSANDIEEARHSIIMRLQNAFFKQSLQERGLTATERNKLGSQG